MIDHESRTRKRSRDDELETAVAKTVSGLQSRIGSEHRDPVAVARLARLRRAVTLPPGSVPEVWLDTIGCLPEDLLGQGDAPSRYETAAHQAITLFAVHQQSTPAGMHRAGVSLGTATRQLVVATDRESAIRSRFQALATANSPNELLHHLRSMVTILRSEQIQLDYGKLAVDLRQLQTPGHGDRVRLRWGRDYHRTTSQPSSGDGINNPAFNQN